MISLEILELLVSVLIVASLVSGYLTVQAKNRLRDFQKTWNYAVLTACFTLLWMLLILVMDI